MKIGAIVLAAGRSKRFGGDKRQAVLPNGKWVLQQTIDNVTHHFHQVLVVLRETDQAFADQLLSRVDQKAPDIFLSADSDNGMGHNLANAIRQVSGWDGAFVFLGDMPYLHSTTINQLIKQLKRDNCVVPCFDKQPGHPVGFGADFFMELAGLCGDQGARQILAVHSNETKQISVQDQGILRDIDQPIDLQ